MQMNADKPNLDISRLSFTELSSLVKQAQSALEAKRGEELKVLADAYAKKLLAADFTIQEGIEALRPYLHLSSRRNTPPTKAVPAKFRGPNGEEWSGRGRTPNWLSALVNAGDSIDKYRV